MLLIQYIEHSIPNTMNAQYQSQYQSLLIPIPEPESSRANELVEPNLYFRGGVVLYVEYVEYIV